MEAELVEALLRAPGPSLVQLIAVPQVHSSIVRTLLKSAQTGTGTSITARLNCSKLVYKLVHVDVPGSITLAILTAFASAFLDSNRTLVHDIIDHVLITSAHDDLRELILEQGPQLLAQQLAQDDALSTTTSATTTALVAHLALARAHPLVASSYGQSTDLSAALAQAYRRLKPTSDHNELRLALLDTTFALLRHAFLEPLSGTGVGEGPLRADERAAFWSELDGVLRPIFTGSSSHSTSDLVSDLARYLNFGERLQIAADGLEDSDMLDRSRDIIAKCQRAANASDGHRNWLNEIKSERSRAATTHPTLDKDKARAHATQIEPVDASAVAQVLDLFPSLAPAFVKLALSHPAIDSAEQLISALLDDDGSSLPAVVREAKARAERGEPLPELDPVQLARPTTAPTMPASAPIPAPPAPVPTSVFARSNRFDAPALDLRAGKLRRGKGPSHTSEEDDMLSAQLKALIIARAERDSSDEDSENNDDDEAFVPEPSDNEAGGHRAAYGVRDAGEGEHDAEDGFPDLGNDSKSHSRRDTPGLSRPTTPAPSGSSTITNPFSAIITTFLEQTYAAQGPSVFARTTAARSSKARDAIRKGSGLTDERIEEWGSMFERNPRKDKILSHHAIAPAQNSHQAKSSATPTNDNASSPGSGHSQAQHASNSNPGQGQQKGGGRGGARGRGGGAAAHYRRSRGHDKKMQRMGAGAGAGAGI